MMETLTAFKVEMMLLEHNASLFIATVVNIVDICRSFVESVEMGWAMSLLTMALKKEFPVSEFSATRSSLSPVKVGWQGRAKKNNVKLKQRIVLVT